MGTPRQDERRALHPVAEWIFAPQWPRLLGRREWFARFGGHELRVVTRGVLTARLYVDGRCRDRRAPWLSWNRSIPLLSARLPGRDVLVAEVYCNVPLTNRVSMRIGLTRIHPTEIAATHGAEDRNR